MRHTLAFRRWLLKVGLGSAVLCAGTGWAAAQLPLPQLERRTWNLSQGAPLNLIDMTEDTHGVIWLTSPGGLYTFNGESFTVFHQPSDLDPVASLVFTVSHSSSGNVWGASRTRGLIRIDPQHRVTGFGPSSGLPGHAASGVRQDAGGDAWAIADGKLFHLVAESWQQESSKRGLPVTPLVCDLLDTEGTLWVASRAGLFRKPLGASAFQPTAEQWQTDETPTQLFQGPHGSVWVSLRSANRQETLIRQTHLTEQPATSGLAITLPYSAVDAAFDSQGMLWITGQGVDRVTFPRADPQPSGVVQQALPIVEHLGAKDGLSSDATRAILIDNHQDVWVATMRGLERFRTPVLVKATTPPVDSSTVPDLASGRDGAVLLGGRDTPLYLAKGRVAAASGPVMDSFYCLFQDSKGDTWFNSQKGLWHKQGDNVLALPLPEGVTYGRLRQIVELPDRSLLFSFYERGVWRWSEEHWSPTPVGKAYGENPTVLFVDPSGTLWSGYPSGRITFGNGTSESVVSGSESQIGTIQGFYTFRATLLASGQRGMLAFISKRLQLLRFANETVATNVSGMVQSGNGDLWLNGQYGVARVLLAEMQQAIDTQGQHTIEARIFTQTDIQGPAPFFYDLPTAAKDATGLLWFNTSGSLVNVDPTQVAGHAVLPIIAVNDILVDGLPLEARAAVPPRPQTLRIAYFGSNLSAPEQVRYRYRLAGVDSTWQEVGSRTEAVYTHLRPGNYTFEVAATSGEGVWTLPASMQFRVRPAFYETALFRLVCVACAASLLLFAYRWRLQYISNRFQERAEERAEERVRIARDLHDTLLQGFQGLILRFHTAALRLPETNPARGELDLALDKAEKIMGEGRDRVSLLRSDDLRGVSLREALLAFCAEATRESGPAYSVENMTGEEEIKSVVKDEVYWIVREALSNAFRHARAHTVRVEITYDVRQLQVLCIDDGCGIDYDVLQAGAKTGHYGLPGTRERARRVNAIVSYVSAPMEGTRVRVTIPGSFAYTRKRSLIERLRAYTQALPG